MAVHLPALPGPQEAAWHALFELYERQPDGWTLVGGQLVHLHCAERGLPAARPTDDADAALDVRRRPTILLRVTAVLQDMGFRSAGVAPGGAHTVPGDADRRHRIDFLTLATGLSRRDAEADRLRPRDLTYLRTMCAAIDVDPVALAAVDGASVALSRIKQLIAA